MKPQFLLITILILILSTNTQSQTTKIGYINSLDLVSLMPEAKVADEEILKLAQELDAIYKEYIQQYQTKYYKIQSDSTLTAEGLQLLNEDLLALEGRIKQMEQTSQDKITKKRAELYQPILEKATSAVQETAKDNGYTHILDSSNGMIIYAPEGDNILQLVKKKLGIL